MAPTHGVELHGCADPFALSPDEIGKRVAAAGVVGLGGAAFPSAVKLIGASRAKRDDADRSTAASASPISPATTG